MKILLDTCAFLWITTDSEHVTETARAAFRDPGNQIYLSAVSAWEITIKHSAGRLRLPETPAKFIPRRRTDYSLISLPFDEGSALHEAKLPRLHGDPFDRMLICQAMMHGLVLMTPDEMISQYPVRTLW
jgi:PIN domain nuclease of toxin-antitoxin system